MQCILAIAFLTLYHQQQKVHAISNLLMYSAERISNHSSLHLCDNCYRYFLLQSLECLHSPFCPTFLFLVCDVQNTIEVTLLSCIVSNDNFY